MQRWVPADCLGNYSASWGIFEGRIWASLLAEYIVNHLRLHSWANPCYMGDCDILAQIPNIAESVLKVMGI